MEEIYHGESVDKAPLSKVRNPGSAYKQLYYTKLTFFYSCTTMTLKLKLKVNPSKETKKETENKPIPKIRIKPLKKEPSDGISKPKVKKEKLKKLKISLGKPSQPTTPADSPAPPAPAAVPKRVPKVRIKPTRIPGEGYDSEAPDLEDDPLIEQGIVVRFANDRNLDFVHNAVDTGDLSNVNIKWITRDKAVVNVNLTLYSARLIDLPTLTELYKTVDKKNIFKTIDISQILLVLHPINPKKLNLEQDFEVPEEHTYVHPIYNLSPHNEIRNTKTVYRHGLAYAYEDVYRRFRPRKVNHRVMTDIELRVDELVRRDNEAQESHYEFTDPRAQVSKFTSSNSHAPAAMPSASSLHSDVFGEEEEVQEEEMALDIEDDIDNALEQELAEALDSTSNTTAATVLMKSVFDNDEAASDENDNNGQAEEDEEDDDDDDDDDDDEDDEDDTTKRGNSQVKKLEEEISDLERAADKQKLLLATASFKMMRMKFQSAYNGLRAQIDQKKRELAKIQELQDQKLPVLNADNAEPDEDEGEDDDGDDEDEEDEDDEDGEEEKEEAHADAETKDGEPDHQIPDESHSIPEPQVDDDNDDFDDFQGLF